MSERVVFKGGYFEENPDPLVVELAFHTDRWDSSKGFTRIHPSPALSGVQLDGSVWHSMRAAMRDTDPAYKKLEQERDALQEQLDAMRAKYDILTSERDWQPRALWVVPSPETLECAPDTPVGSLADDLKNTIVSQAREIARLKGGSA
ncbi:hypothetical protein [Streptomyces albipurpureus]|uniref:Uncharacterized protein n=1 Tax=Streptomyces albipurpureus TaxID=2897419 RepID=A0ABT0UTM2_9ACTN|nr:hypothetical protein [Streptomyces sp. CWNU-1]MCM2391727.1 hypothetical protein [Streptomyces sp. CWNU-1]